jgi:hypothetical protein
MTLALTGCDVTVTTKPGAGESGDGPHLPPPPPVSESRDQLAGLTVAGPASMRGYDRDKFPHWSEQDRGCTTREVVLRRDGTGVAVGDDCYPTSGRWYSVYDQRWFSEPSKVDIDHMVPLANAWRSGANRWTNDRRKTFANDLERGQLIAVSAASNRAKGDQDPSQWRPGNRAVWCDYARWWIDVKNHYRLTVTDAERSALREMLGTC